jgi:hypothetical protein
VLTQRSCQRPAGTSSVSSAPARIANGKTGEIIAPKVPAGAWSGSTLGSIGGERVSLVLLPLADDLRVWFLASGRPRRADAGVPGTRRSLLDKDDWRNWRRRAWQGEPERPRRDRKNATPAREGCAPAGTRPRDQRSSYVTLRVYEGVPLTQIASEVGTSVRMIEQHYSGAIANWDGKQVAAETQIRRARPRSGRKIDAAKISRATTNAPKPLQIW